MKDTITIIAKVDDNQAKPIEIQAEVFGPMAVHRDINDDRIFSITHIKTGRCLKLYLTRKDAIAIARILGSCWKVTTRQREKL